ncbi:MAG TPA: hypothetical protein PLF28_08850 [Agitococcus sp.]|nr:hypothetical protein [Agitococcus sp.]
MFLQIGEQFACDGLLENGRDIFYLSLEEIYAWYDLITENNPPLLTICTIL